MTQKQHDDFPCLFNHGDLVIARDGKTMIFDKIKKIGNKHYYTFFYVDTIGDLMTRRCEYEHISHFKKLNANYSDKLDTFKELFEVK